MSMPAHDIARQRKSYHKCVSAGLLKPLWEVLDSLVPEQPKRVHGMK